MTRPGPAVEELGRVGYVQAVPHGALFTGPRADPAPPSGEWRRVGSVGAIGSTIPAAMPQPPWRACRAITTKELMARSGHSSPRGALVCQHGTRSGTAPPPPSSTARSPPPDKP